MKKNLLLLFALIVLSFNSSSQQDPLTTMFWNTYSHFNPATTGTEYLHQASVLYRMQWVGLSGSPNTLFANYNTRIGKHHGVGGNYTYETIGFSKNHSAHLNYNYQFNIDKKRRLSFGISPGFTHVSYDGIFIAPTSTPDPELQPSRTSNMNFNGGIVYQGKSLYGGVGVTQFYEVIKYKTIAGLHNFVPHYYAHLRTTLRVNRKALLHLEGLFRTDAINYSFDLNARTTLFKKLTLGAGYRFSESLNFSASWDFKEKYRIGYSFDSPHTDNLLNTHTSGSHEITLGLLIPHKPSFLETKIGSPNF